MRTITLITESGDSYPVGGCYFAERSTSQTGSYFATDLNIVTPSGNRVYTLDTVRPPNIGGTGIPTSEMVALRDKINAALQDPAIDVLDLREECKSSIPIPA
jgi:hypothetical protein